MKPAIFQLLRIFQLLQIFQLFQLSSALLFLNWTTLILDFEFVSLSQRDLSRWIPTNQINTFGISLNLVVFGLDGYTKSSASNLLHVLDLKLGTVTVDLYWNEYSQKWQLCPAPFPTNTTYSLGEKVQVSWKNSSYICEPDFTVADLVSTLSLYMSTSNREININMVKIGINLKSIDYTPLTSGTNSSVPDTSAYNPPALSSVGNSSLSTNFNNLGTNILTPVELLRLNENGLISLNSTAYDSYFPTLSEFLFLVFKRSMVFVLSNSLSSNGPLSYNITSTDRDTVFFPNSDNFNPFISTFTNSSSLDFASWDSTILKNFTQETSFRFVFDSEEDPFLPQNVSSYAQSGITPILNATTYDFSEYSEDSEMLQLENNSNYLLRTMNLFMPYSFWGWAPNQPLEPDLDLILESLVVNNDTWSSVSDTLLAYRCAAMTTAGWAIDNCYNQYRYACKNTTDPFDWTISSKKAQYFSAASTTVCPEGYDFAVPELGVEQLVLATLLQTRKITTPIWVDLNDVSISGCYVAGGPYASCPYKDQVSTGSLVRRIGPTAAVAAIIIVLIFCEKFFRFRPIQNNRKKYWKRTITEYYKKNDFDGVPP